MTFPGLTEAEDHDPGGGRTVLGADVVVATRHDSKEWDRGYTPAAILADESHTKRLFNALQLHDGAFGSASLLQVDRSCGPLFGLGIERFSCGE
jgi:hypothetical protein